MTKELLRLEGLNAWYGESHILHGVDLTVNEGEVVCLLGRNGAGRTTTMRAIVGLTGARTGSIRINGEEAIKLPPHKVARLGVGYCPEERGIFASLSAEENLMLPPVIGPGGMSVEDIYGMFPNLKERAAAPARACPAASSRCWPWRAFCALARACCCWMKFPKAWHRSSCRSSPR
jgi:branched-chain amino acid transport system ATP-binding protein